MADSAVYLRAVTPFEAFETATEEVVDDTEQRLFEMLTQNDTEPVYTTVGDDLQWRVVRMRVTAYCPCAICCGKFADGVTACNHKIESGDAFVAADKAFRFRTEMIVPGYNNNQPVQVLDRGRVIKGNRLDVFFHSHDIARQWGTQTLDVLIRQ